MHKLVEYAKKFDVGIAIDMESSKRIIRVVDLLGKETKQKKGNQLLIYLYDDGSVDKKFILE